MNADKASELGMHYYSSGYSCAEASLMAICETLGIESDLIPKIATPFAGGICGGQSICGAVTGSFMAIGVIMGRSEAGASRELCYKVCMALKDHVDKTYSTTTCRTLTGYDMSDNSINSDFRKSVSKSICIPIVGECCHFVVEELNKHILKKL